MSEAALITHLKSLRSRDDRGALAALRRGLTGTPGTIAETFPHVAPFIPERDNVDGRDWPYFLTAGLFALHPAPGGAGNLGRTCRRLGDHPSAEKRFQALLASDRTQLPARLRQVVALARSHDNGVPIDWSELLTNLRHWEHPDGWVQRRWARSYWTQETQAKDTSASKQP